MIYVLIIYLSVLIISLIGYYFFNKHVKGLMNFFVYQCEKINFAFLLALEDEKNNIVKYKELITILLAKKHFFLKGKGYKLDRFMSCYFGLNSDMKYFEQLVQKKKFDYAIFVSLQEVSNIIKGLLRISNFLYLLLSYMTFGLFFIIQKKMYS